MCGLCFLKIYCVIFFFIYKAILLVSGSEMDTITFLDYCVLLKGKDGVLTSCVSFLRVA